MDIRAATSEDLDLLQSLIARRESELPPPPHVESPEGDIALIASQDGRAVGYLVARHEEQGATAVSDLWVDPASRGRGIGHELLRRAAADALARGSTHLVIDVRAGNSPALAFLERLGFEEATKTLHIGLERLLAERAAPAESLGALHIQSDDAPAVERAVVQYLPRVARGASAQVEPSRAWTAVRIEPFDRDALRKLGAELSHRFGVTVLLALEEGAVVRYVIHDRGRIVDEYLSVPQYYGPLPPGDVAALRANPTVVSRLTGAPRESVRAVAQTGDRPGDLPPAEALYARIAEVLGLQP